MSWEFCNQKTVKRTKKDHNCEFCGRVIPKGSQNIFNWSGKFDGEMVNSYACHWCDSNEDRLVDDYDNTIKDFWDCLHFDFFMIKFKNLKSKGTKIFFFLLIKKILTGCFLLMKDLMETKKYIESIYL